MVTQTFMRAVERFRQPEYTGENRCRTCTLLNSLIAFVLAAAVALLSVPAAVLLLVVSAAAITFRGYLVPGTPTLVRFLPDVVHEAIGPDHAVDPSSSGGGDPPSVDVEERLRAAGVVTECADVDDLCLTDDYRAAWHERMAEFRDSDRQRRRLSESLSVPAGDISFRNGSGGWSVLVDGTRAGEWGSEAAFRADLASEQLLGSWLGDWDTLPAGARTRMLATLRAFLDSCPDCGGDVTAEESVVSSCCSSDTVAVTTVCETCGATLFEGTERGRGRSGV